MGQRYQCFNTQPPEGGWVIDICNLALSHVSTRSRPKAAGFSGALLFTTEEVSTRSRPKAAGGWIIFFLCEISCFNTQPPEGGWAVQGGGDGGRTEFQHAAARRRLGLAAYNRLSELMFQHAAARRRLADCRPLRP